MKKNNINKDTIIDAMEDIFYTTKKTIWGLKKLYIIDVKTKGKYNNVVKGKRLFLFKKHATDFYNLCKEIDCEVEFYTMKNLGGDCYFEDK